MGTLEQLEAGLRDSFDAGHLAVYADVLQAHGDPRGELIAIDLERDAGNWTDELAARRSEILANLVPEHDAIRCRYGFVTVVDSAPTPMLDTVLLGPYGTYVRELTIAGSAEDIRCVVTTLVLRARPWLERLTIRQTDWGNVQLSQKLASGLVEMLPRLHTVNVTGRNVFPLVALPTVTTLVASPVKALAALIDPAAGGSPPEVCLPAVTDLDALLMLDHQTSFPANQQHTVLPASQLPALRRLDLRRNTQLPVNTGVDVFRFVAQLALAAQLEQLRLPRLDHVEQAIALQSALDRMPNLTQLEIFGANQARHFELHHPTATITVEKLQ